MQFQLDPDLQAVTKNIYSLIYSLELLIAVNMKIGQFFFQPGKYLNLREKFKNKQSWFDLIGEIKQFKRMKLQ